MSSNFGPDVDILVRDEYCSFSWGYKPASRSWRAILVNMNGFNQDNRDTPRPVATSYSITLEEAGLLFREAGLPRNLRSLQRYCAGGRLDCIKEETINGLQYFVDPASVDRAIIQLAQLHGISEEVRHAEKGRHQSPPSEGTNSLFARHDIVGPGPTKSDPVAPEVEPILNPDIDRPAPTLSRHVEPENSQFHSTDIARPSPTASDAVATDGRNDMDSSVAARRDNNEPEINPAEKGSDGHVRDYAQDFIDLLKSENSFLRQQVSVKDEQIADLLERDRESNILVQGLQKLLQPLLRAPGGPSSSDSRDTFDYGHREHREGDKPGASGFPGV